MKEKFSDKKQEEKIGKQTRIETILFKPWEHTDRIKKYFESKSKFEKLENYHKK